MGKDARDIIGESGIVDPILDEQVGLKAHEICRVKYKYYYFINSSVGWEDTLPLNLRRADQSVSFADYVAFFNEQGKRYYAELNDIKNCLHYDWIDSWFDLNQIIDFVIGENLHFDVVVLDVLNDTRIVGEDGYGRFLSKVSFDQYRSKCTPNWVPSLIMDKDHTFILFNPMGIHYRYYILLSNRCCDQFVDNVNVHVLDPNQELDDFDLITRF